MNIVLKIVETSLRMILSNCFITILLHSSLVMTQAPEEESESSGILEKIKFFRTSLMVMEKAPFLPFFGGFPLLDRIDQIYRQLMVQKKSNDGENNQLHESVMVTEATPKISEISKILENMKSLPSNLMEIKKVPVPSFLRRLRPPGQIDRRYRRLNMYKHSNDSEKHRLKKFHRFADEFIRFKLKFLLNRVKSFVDKAILHCKKYMRFMASADGRHKRCEKSKGQSLNYIIYNAFRYISSVVRKGYSIILQSYAIRNAFEKASDLLIERYKMKYRTTAKEIVSVFKDLANAASTRIASCEPMKPLMSKTYLVMEKFLQGVLPHEVTLNKWNSGKGTCTDYKYQGTPYYPYKYIRHDGDWKCHGLMYECFSPTMRSMDICKPTRPNRRLDGVVEKRPCGIGICFGMVETLLMGNCSSKDRWVSTDWKYRMHSSLYVLEQCACICDDFEHPRTLRKFSREYAISDYKNNMVVTGIRLVNISNIIHIQIQEGKLEELSFINSSTVQWRLENNIANRSTNLDSRSSDEVVTLSYHKRRVNLDVFHFPPNDVVIGVAFDWTREMDGVELTVFVTTFSFSTGELNHDYRRSIAPHRRREEIILEKPHMSELCNNNIPVEGDNKFIKFQTTDWQKDAAQTTVPYLDIQEVVTNPPVMLRGVGLYYKNRRDCGGYIGLELHSRHFDDLII